MTRTALATGLRPSSFNTGSVIAELSGFISWASRSKVPEASPLADTVTRIFPGFPSDLITFDTGISLYVAPSEERNLFLSDSKTEGPASFAGPVPSHLNVFEARLIRLKWEVTGPAKLAG